MVEKMTAEGSDKAEMLKLVFDAMPSMIFIVDEDVRIHEYNAAAAELFLSKREAVLKRRGGEVLQCLHAKDVPEGCGHASFCSQCVIRNSVTEACLGKRVVRRRARIEILRGEDKQEIYALITASPFRFKDRPLVLLVVEDISEIAELKRMIPICSICKEVRDEKETWSRVETYFKEHWDVSFSHSLCPKCFKSEMVKLEEYRNQNPVKS
jgi:PAS domain-containing protein